MKLADLMEDGRRQIRCGVLECGAQIFPLGEAGLVAAAAAGWDVRGALLASTDADLCPVHAKQAPEGWPPALPRLIGLVKLDIPFGRTVPPEEQKGEARELVKTIAFDFDGQPWGLVQREVIFERTPDGGRLGRVNCVEWIPFPAVGFSNVPFDYERWHAWRPEGK